MSLSGLVIHPGDLLHADQHGVLLIPSAIAHVLLAAAERVVCPRAAVDHLGALPEFNAAEIAERRKQ